MTKYLFFITFLLCSILEANVELLFLPNTPVTQKSVLKITQKDLNESSVMQQTLEASFFLKDKSDLPLNRAPFEIIFTLKELLVDIESHQLKTSFDAKKPNTSLLLAEIKDLIDKPVKLKFDKDYKLQANLLSLQQITKELPMLGDLDPQAFIENFFEYLFALAGRELNVGGVITIENKTKKTSIFPQTVTYVITSIDNNWICADFSSKLDIEEKHPSTAPQISGNAIGKARWKKNNALIYHVDLDSSYNIDVNSPRGKKNIPLTINYSITSNASTPSKKDAQ